MTDTLLPCPFCGGNVNFHKDEDCDGCHYIECQSCKGMFDLSTTADPENDTETLEELNERIALAWNARAPAQPDQVQGWRMVPDSLQKLGKRLAELLDEDQFAECEALLLAAAPKPPVQEKAE